jgi:tetratricopeptide (TPR) repeat protein
VLAWLCLPGDARASDSGRAAYDRGDFAQAEAQWRDAGRSHADYWIAHHNLALALAQQQRWAEAAAHATRAFVQNPRDPSVRWHYTYAVSRGGFAPAPLDRFNHPRPQHRVAMMASPAEWQRLLLLAVALLAISAVFLLINGYFRRRALWPILAAVAALLAVTLGALAALSLRTYGPAANPQAVLIWRNTSLRSLPTDVPTDQQASTIHAGSIATVDHAFLGWRRLVFANGQTGWVRRDEFLPLWNLP